MSTIKLADEVTLSFGSYAMTGALLYTPDLRLLSLDVDPIKSRMDPDDAAGPPERLSVNLAAYDLVPEADTTFVKDWTEHVGLAGSLVKTGLVEVVREVFVGPFETRAYELRILAAAVAAATDDGTAADGAGA